MHKALHSRDDIDILYVSRKEGGRGLVNIEYCLDATIQEVYTQKSKERLIAAARNSNCNTWTSRNTTKTRKQKWEEKQLYGYFKRQTTEIVHVKCWPFLRRGNLKRET